MFKIRIQNFILSLSITFLTLINILSCKKDPINAEEERQKVLAKTHINEETYDLSKSVMQAGYWKYWNESVQHEIDQNIDTYRKVNVTISISNIMPETEIFIEQLSHDFLFGANIFNFNQLGSVERNKRYKELFGSLFNSATVPFYWKKFEMEKDQPRFNTEYRDTENYWNTIVNPEKQPHWRRPSTDQIVDYCLTQNVHVHGHTIVWGSRAYAFPDWLLSSAPLNEKNTLEFWTDKTGNGVNIYKKLSENEVVAQVPNFIKMLNEHSDKRIKELAIHYGSKIRSWDVVNESITDYTSNVLSTTKPVTKSVYGIMPSDYVYRSFKSAFESFPSNVSLDINDVGFNDNYYNQINNLIARGVKINRIGLQHHIFESNKILEISKGKKLYTPEIERSALRQLNTLNTPIHLSEITIPAPNDDDAGRKIQAVIARNLYRLWFSAQNITAITWWNLVDNSGATGEPTTSGMFYRDMQPKEAYFVLNDLINKVWKTKEKIKQTNNEKHQFRAFRGKYMIKWTDKNKNIIEKTIEINKDIDISL